MQRAQFVLPLLRANIIRPLVGSMGRCVIRARFKKYTAQGTRIQKSAGFLLHRPLKSYGIPIQSTSEAVDGMLALTLKLGGIAALSLEVNLGPSFFSLA